MVYKSLPAYRLAFFAGLRDRLDQEGIEFRLIYGNPDATERMKGDGGELPWAEFVPNRFASVGRKRLIWQPILGRVATSDLVVAEQASRLLVNYALQGWSRVGGPRFALWGHGANLQVHTTNPVAEWSKRKVARLPHWWFAYTEGCKERVASYGFPPGRITVVQNAIDTRRLALAVANARSTGTAREGSPVALFIGSLYAEKRLDFLLEASDEIARLVPSFELVIAGDGPEMARVRAGAERRAHVRILGRVDGEARVRALAEADVVLMPGLVGLATLDAFAAGAPLVTTALDYHSPEIEYVVQDVNGLILPEATTAAEYGQAVAALLGDPDRLARLRAGCREAADRFTNEAMVDNFTSGVLSALEPELTP